MSSIWDAIFRLVVTFVVMGVWVTIIAVSTEKRGGKLGAFLVGFPSTAALSFFFTGLFVSVPAAVNATRAFPVFLSIIGIFLLCFGYLANKGFLIAILISLLAWFAAAFLVILSGLDDFGESLVVGLGMTAILYCAFRWNLKPKKPSGGPKPKYTVPLLGLRFILGGGIVTLALLMGQLGIPILSAMFSSFPALSISTLVAIRANNPAEGTKNAKGMTMAIFVSIMLMIIPFSIVVHVLYPSLGVWWGTAVGYLVAAAFGIPYYFLFEGLLVPSFSELGNVSSS